MGNSKTSAKEGKERNQKAKTAMVKVLYQKMGDRWFAFSMVNDEVFVGSITQSEIDSVEDRRAQSKRIADS